VRCRLRRGDRRLICFAHCYALDSRVLLRRKLQGAARSHFSCVLCMCAADRAVPAGQWRRPQRSHGGMLHSLAFLAKSCARALCLRLPCSAWFARSGLNLSCLAGWQHAGASRGSPFQPRGVICIKTS
jgi:hypothetical protein